MRRERLDELWRTLPRRLISEATLARLLRRVAHDQGFALVTAYKTMADRSKGEHGVDWRTNDENAQSNLELSRYLTGRLGKSVIGVGGGWSPADPQTGKPLGELAVAEPSFFVIGIGRQEAEDLARYAREHFNQNSIIWGSVEDGIWEFDGDGGEMFKGRAFDDAGHLAHPEKVLGAWSTARGRAFAFSDTGGINLDTLRGLPDFKDLPTEGVLEYYMAYVPTGMMETMSWHTELDKLRGVTRLGGRLTSCSSHAEYSIRRGSMDGIAFFISPDGHIVDVPRTHIARIIDDPQLFGLTREEIEQVFQQFDEPLYTEANARQEIMRQVLGRGWIRVRERVGREGHWMVQFDRWSADVHRRVKQWARKMLARRGAEAVHDRHADVRLVGLDGNENTLPLSGVPRMKAKWPDAI